MIWILVGAGTLLLCLPITCIGAITVFGGDLRRAVGADADPATLVDEDAPSPITRRTEDDREVVEVEWTIDSQQPRLRSVPFDISVVVERPDGSSAADGRVIVLWGRQFGASSALEGPDTYVGIWPALPGAPRAIAVMDDAPGGAVMECEREQPEGAPVRWRCHGVIDPDLDLRLPAAPDCRNDGWEAMFDLIAPGTCFGLTAEQFSKVRAPLIHVQTRTYDDFRVWPWKDRGAPRFEIALGQTADRVELEEKGAHAAEGFRALRAALTKKLGEPQQSVAVCARNLRFGGGAGPGASLRGALVDCADPDGEVEAFTLEAWTAQAD